LSAYSDSLLFNLTNNPTELFNSIICKEIGGKRIHFGKRGSYNARIAGAVVQHNTQQILTQIYKSMQQCSFHYRKSRRATKNKNYKN